MVLLPLIEHALRAPARLPASIQSLAIEVAREGDRLRVVVADSAGAFATAEETDPVADVRSRLQALYGSTASLSFAAVPSRGTQAIVDLPYNATASFPFPLQE